MTAHPVPVLIPGRVNARVVDRVSNEFRPVMIERADPDLVDDAMKAEIRAIASMTVITADFIDAFPNLEIIAHFGVGYDMVDADHAGKKGIAVTHTPDVLTDEVADTALGLLINTVRELPRAEAYLRAGRWLSEGSYPLTPLTLRQRSVGIYGLGRIGRAIATRLEAFGLPVAYHTRNRRHDVSYRYAPTLIELAETVDTLIAVVPGGEATRNAVSTPVLEALGSDGVLISIGRGTTIDEPALIEALRNGTIAAAGLDVFADEPNVPEALIALPNASLLPHVASASVHTRKAMADLVVDNLCAWFENGKPLTAVPETRHVVARSGR